MHCDFHHDFFRSQCQDTPCFFVYHDVCPSVFRNAERLMTKIFRENSDLQRECHTCHSDIFQPRDDVTSEFSWKFLCIFVTFITIDDLVQNYDRTFILLATITFASHPLFLTTPLTSFSLTIWVTIASHDLVPFSISQLHQGFIAGGTIFGEASLLGIIFFSRFWKVSIWRLFLRPRV